MSYGSLIGASLSASSSSWGRSLLLAFAGFVSLIHAPCGKKAPLNDGGGGGAGGDAAAIAIDASKPPDPPPPIPEVLAWVLPYENSLVSFERNARFISIASPTYFRLAVDVAKKSAKIEDWDPAAPFPRARLTKALPAADPSPADASSSSSASPPMEILPLVGCIGACGPKISRLLDDEVARKAHVADLLRVTREQNLAGLVIDYEDVDATEPSVMQFVDELAKGLHDAGKRIVLVVQEPCGADPVCHRTPYPFTLKTLVKKVDVLAVMEYDFVVDGTGAPAPRAWVEKGLTRVTSEIDAADLRKVVCAVPFYGRVTKGIADDTAVLFDEAKLKPPSKIRKAKVTFAGPMTFDPAMLSKTATVRGAKKSGTLYLEDQETIRERITLAVTQFKLGGIAIWRLGGEDPCISLELAKLRGVEPPPNCTAP